jgi:hypothetical protein
MKHLTALILIALLPAIAAGKGSSGHSGHHKSAVAKRNARGRIARNSSAKRTFEASSPCPATGKTTGSCKGYVIDQKTPLACGGADAPENMQWQTAAAAKLKDKTERAGCGT